MATDYVAAIEMLLKQQQDFTKNLLSQQQLWMQSILENKATPEVKLSDHQMVPAFQKFNKDQHQWDSYFQQLEQHFTAYLVSSGEQRKSFFLSWCGTEMFDLLKNLFGVNCLSNQTYEEITEKLTEHFSVSQHVIAARYNFFKSRMHDKQSYKDWVANLRGLARSCKFVCNSDACAANYVDDMIRDQIILNTPHETVRSAALQKQRATLADVLSIAESFEATTKTIAIIKDGENEKTMDINVVKKKVFNKVRKDKNEKEIGKYKSCSGCFISHNREECKFRNAICHKCAKKGHIAAVCMTKQNQRNQSVFRKKKQNNNIDVVETIYDVTGKVNIENSKSVIYVEMQNKNIKFQMDSGASISIINFKTFELLNKPKLIKTNRILYGFGRKIIPVLGELHINMKCGNREKKVILIVVNNSKGENLFGYDLFKEFGFEIKQINSVWEKDLNSVKELCEKYREIFKPALGTVKDFKASIHLKADARPKFFRSRPIPFAQMPQFRAEIKRLVEQKIIIPIKFSDWASPIVIARKPNDSIRICGDFKVAVNSQIDIEQYPLPTRENLFHTIRNGKYFSKIDLKDAYLQMELDDHSKKIMVINTPLGLYQYQRLPYGIASAPAIFQKHIEQLLYGIKGCANYLDDIIISAPTLELHFHRLKQVFSILLSNGIRCKEEKCAFLQKEITYLGRKIGARGILPDESGLLAVKNLKPPRNLKELEAFLGKVNYYNNFVKDFSTIAAPLNMLRRKNTKFVWGKSQQKSFEQLKLQIVNATQLAYFQDNLPLVLATDASPYGLGAVISHIYEDGSERPIAFASKTLDKHQQNYSQIEKEGLAIIFGVKRFHQFLYGRKFLLLTDHKPLLSIFNPNKQLPTMAAHRIQRWAITLMAYNFEIKYRKTTDHANADALSRLPIGMDKKFDKEEESCHFISFDKFPLKTEIYKYSKLDKTIQTVCNFIKNGWPNKLSVDKQYLKPFFDRRDNLTIYNNLLCMETDYIRVIIPERLRQNMLNLLHNGHWGVVKMKQLARQNIWWHNIDKDIERLSSMCEVCKIHNQAPARSYVSWPKSTKPWDRIHIDFAGPIFNTMWLICVDAYSQFPYISSMKNTTTEDTISALTAIFSIEGLPNTIVSDNGTQLTSEKFNQFCSKLGIQHIKTTPFHPASNGLAERFVRTFKTAVTKNLEDNLSVKDAVLKFLNTYRFMPNDEGKSPAELLRVRQVRTIWSQLFELRRETIQRSSSEITKYQINDTVYVKNFGKGKKWLKGIISGRIGRVIFLINTEKGTCRRHLNQIKPCYKTTTDLSYFNNNFRESEPTLNNPTLIAQQVAPQTSIAHQPSAAQPSPLDKTTAGEFQQSDHLTSDEAECPDPDTLLHKTNSEQQQNIPVRKSTRNRKEVFRFQADDFRKWY